jgi:hypothetical protein
MVECLWIGQGGRRALTKFRDGEHAGPADMLIPPPVLDAALLSVLFLLERLGNSGVHLVHSIERVVLAKAPGQVRFAYGTIEVTEPGTAQASIRLLEEDGTLVLGLEGCGLRRPEG